MSAAHTPRSSGKRLAPGLVVALALAAGAASAANLVPNPSFDQVNAAGMPENWSSHAWTANCDATSGTKPGERGTRYLAMGVRGNGGVYGCFSRAIDVSQLNGRRLMVSCRYKTVEAPYAQFMVVSFKDDFMKMQWQTRPLATEARKLVPSNNWSTCTWFTDVKPGTGQIVVMTQLMSVGGLMVDDVVVRTAPDEMAWSDLDIGRVAQLPAGRRAAFRLEARQAGVHKVTVALTPFVAGKPRQTQRKPLVVEQGTPVEVDLRYNLPASDAHLVELSVTDDATRELLLFQRCKVPGLVDAWVLEPAFRATVMASVPDLQIQIAGRVFAVPAVASQLKLEARNTATGATATEGSGITRAPDDSFTATLPATGMLEGPHEMRLTALQGKAQAATTRLWVTRAAGGLGETYYDANHRIWTNGRSVFPLAVMNATSTEDLRTVVDAGFNTFFVPSGLASQILADAAAPKGLNMVVFSPGTFKTFWDGLQAKLGRHPALLGWELSRRPDAGLIPPEVSMALHGVLASASPNHPTITTLTFPEAMSDYAPATDIIIPWEFAVPQFPLSVVGDMVDAALRASEGRKPVWGFVQGVGTAWAWDKTLDDQAEGRMPTPAEVRAQAYLSLVHGASGLVYYALNISTSKQERTFRATLDGAEQWAAISRVNREVAGLVPILSQRSARRLLPAAAEGLIHMARWTTADQDLLIAVSVSPTPTVASLPIEGFEGSEITVAYENRTLTTAQPGLFGDIFQPYEVHVYALK